MFQAYKRPLVISIAAVSGGGKTEVTTSLIQQLANAKALYFDDYDFEGPNDILGWLENGANYNAWNLTPLITDLGALLSQSLSHVVLDYPFAYAKDQISKLIDFAVFIDTPLDVALARRLVRDFGNSTITEVMSDMSNYLLHGRPAYLEALNTIRPQSDFVVNGALPVSEITRLLIERLDAIQINA